MVRRRPVRVVLLVALYLLTSAATAYAECAWVLWEEVSTAPNFAQATWNAITGVGTPGECTSAKDAKIADQIKFGQTMGPTRSLSGEWVQWHTRDEKDNTVRMFAMYRYRCLPDTLDPRGPKGTK